ncbi:SH3 domain protein [Povalibacter uvarum]|uniref:SH3 domain protein n=1 Tax=Povalibacter uvarum TaxID=732238 RepID=A0A841HH79_9GAMM|nr:SH3 domain-containing protein [Povalibacter uvarum]MBB6092297.1 SH3 domain protein [Povalibacter uvarum]
MKHHTCCLLLTACALATGAGIAVAQDPAQSQPDAAAQAAALPRRYVSDKLVLNVYAEPDSASARVATIETGDAIGEIETSGTYVRVRLSDGREGWVGASYLTAEMPAAARLRELQGGQKAAVAAAEKKAADEILRLKSEAAALQAQLTELRAAQTTRVAEPAPTQATIPPDVEEHQEEPRLTTQPLTSSRNAAWIWPLALVGAAGVSFLAGYQALARRIRKRYGGLKIY